MSDDAYYGDWAYRGQARDYTGDPLAPEAMSKEVREGRRRLERLPRTGAQCGEFLHIKDATDFERAGSQFHADGLRRFGSGMIWPSLKNPLVIVYVARSFSLWATIFLGMASVAGLMAGVPLTWATTIVLPALIGIHLLCRLLIKLDVVPSFNDTIFYRRTGMIEIPQGWFRPPIQLPFAEFDPYIGPFNPGTGAKRFTLVLAHRQSEQVVVASRGGVMEKATAALDWEKLQHYMDVNRPMPELPDLDGIQGDDPVTAESDALRGRPQRLWGEMRLNGFFELEDASRRAAKQFPFGITRRQAFSEGWRPSLYGRLVAGELTYREFVAWLEEQGYWGEHSDPEQGYTPLERAAGQ